MNNLADMMLLFASSLLAATLLPAQSEAVLAGLYLAGKNNSLTLLIVATTGNVLGSCINWFLGRYLIHFQDRKWFPIKADSIDKSSRFYEKWGVWTLLLAWLPIIGDPLTLIAGIFRTNFFLFLLLVTIGKTLRYAVLLAVL